MADYVPSSTGQGQGSAQVLEGSFTPVNMDETVKAIDNVAAEQKRQAAEQRAEIRRQEAEQRAIEKKKEEERRKQQQKDANDLIKQRQTAEGIANAGGTTTETNLAINQSWVKTQDLMKEPDADLPQILQNFIATSTQIKEVEGIIADKFKALANETGTYKVYDKNTNQYIIGLPPINQSLLDGTLYSSDEERYQALTDGTYASFLTASLLEPSEDVVSMGDGSTLDSVVRVMVDSIDANKEEASGFNLAGESGINTTSSYTAKQQVNIAKVITNNIVEKEKERNRLLLRSGLKYSDLGERFDYDGMQYENFDDYWGQAVKYAVSNVSGSTKFELNTGKGSDNGGNNNLKFESSNETKGAYSGERILLPGIGTFSINEKGEKVVQLKNGEDNEIIPFDKKTKADVLNFINTQPKERRKGMLKAFNEWADSEVITDEVVLYVDNLLQEKSDTGYQKVEDEEEEFITDVVAKYNIDTKQEGWTDFVTGLKDAKISDFESSEHRERIIKDLKVFINSTEEVEAEETQVAEENDATNSDEITVAGAEEVPKIPTIQNIPNIPDTSDTSEKTDSSYSNKVIPQSKVELPNQSSDTLASDIKLTLKNTSDSANVELDEKVVPDQIDTLNKQNELSSVDQLAMEVLEQDPRLGKNGVEAAAEYLGINENDVESQETIRGFYESTLNNPADSLKGTDPTLPTLTTGQLATERAWCAAFAFHVLKEMGVDASTELSGYDKVRAKEYMRLGTKVYDNKKKDNIVSDAKVGDLIIKMKLVKNEETGKFKENYHVGFFAGMSPKSNEVLILGGNQNDEVNVTSYPSSEVQSINRIEGLRDLNSDDIINKISSNIKYPTSEDATTR